MLDPPLFQGNKGLVKHLYETYLQTPQKNNDNIQTWQIISKKMPEKTDRTLCYLQSQHSSRVFTAMYSSPSPDTPMDWRLLVKARIANLINPCAGKYFFPPISSVMKEIKKKTGVGLAEDKISLIGN